MIDDHRTAGRNRFLHRRASGFPDEQMTLVQHTRKLVGPADDLRGMTIYYRFDCRPDFITTPDRYGEIDAKISK